MRSAALRHLIQIQRKTELVDPSGEVVTLWGAVAVAHAELVQRTDRESATGFGESEAAHVTFRIRWRAGITTGDRIVTGDGRTFDIREVAEIGRRRGLELKAVAA
ncbi:phage head closure protein [Rhodobacter sphaeroides]|jgi:phage head-tail adaptor, putative, SPP1 family|uniref:Phage head-tail adaptor, putative, SPP1 family n=1 Tax=Cereibacter sphaeroides (strain ATCC 17023 / DSM 158 / JCM 6121 / CCUG 31486 / LMG 2827 / NBRC 12203 / NCIMB 8253 / ATH 2.4.1.) TaxID=272943 RepID=Q3J3X3_CERS4|nr:phage head closure protein [Cereibacter sphaeroides]ABA78511.1 phage head-tail adaptor, putative, SPP1 family [Cereibacter sphaeroides 2.4.1]AMJ46862.1 head-tail adaptor protein [Cereibacter sphaeroides]ANS33575.1 head-tail adaptor protein [Cereibacter sphaeroides]ATN62618.1 head-tail adaptor protein [Cereibacter sphaeroides]AXC60731.1 head-tail adaptor protein [Cereibacter sphaeroides 2.4.1]